MNALTSNAGIVPRGWRLKPVAICADRREMDLSAIALQGMEQAQVHLENASTRLAGAGASPGGANLDIVDLSAEMVALMSAKTDFSINLTVLKTVNQIQKDAIDLMA